MKAIKFMSSIISIILTATLTLVHVKSDLSTRDRINDPDPHSEDTYYHDYSGLNSERRTASASGTAKAAFFGGINGGEILIE